jgi:RimJ/RimL family protein N-acetyltransferase
MQGRLCRLAPLSAQEHGGALHEAHALDREGRNWTYLPYGPFGSLAEYSRWLEWAETQEDPQFFAIVDAASGQPVGTASYLRIEQAMGAIEVGHLAFSPRLQRTPAATEAMYLMMRRAFDELGYRRYEWKCDSLNAPSLAAARRLGFTFEGTFRQMQVVKGRNRDTSWLSVVDSEWPALRQAFEAWLEPANFDAAGKQRRRLGEWLAETRGR